jgi:hypothetical protein
MKTLFTLLLIFSTSLIARDNPFESTNAYEEEAARMVEINEVEEDYAVEYQQEQNYVNEMYEKMNNPNEEKSKKAKKAKETITKDEIKKLIKEAQKKTVKQTKKIVEKAVKEKPKEVQQVVYVKPRVDVSYEKEILPFVKIEYNNDKIDIVSKYKVSKRLTLPGEKKIILDFDAKENFYTKREKLKSSNFLKIAVGNHKKDNFFRIVLELSEKPENYEVSYDNDMVTIVKLYEM